MKMQKQHFSYLKAEIDAILFSYNKDNKLVEEYERGDFPRSNLTANVQKRFCFDLMFGAGLSKFASDNLYPYLDDEHIYTALKKICPQIGVK